MSSTSHRDLPSRLFALTWFTLGWVVLLGFIIMRFWRLHDAFLVWWVFGRDAYFRDGVRVVPGKPVRFTTGELAPQWPDVATGIGFFIVVAFGLTLLLILALRVYERIRWPQKAA